MNSKIDTIPNKERNHPSLDRQKLHRLLQKRNTNTNFIIVDHIKTLRLLAHIVITYKISFARSSLEDKSEEQNVFQSDKRTSNNSSSSTKHGDLLSAMLLARVDRRDSDGGDSDDVPPPLPTTSPPKLSPDSTLTWDHKERMQLKLGNFQNLHYKLYGMFYF